MPRCPNCGQENPDGFRLCGMCGTPLAAAAHETRKVVSILFADVAGSTALGERLDPESLRAVMDRYFAETQRVIERHGGIVEKFIGDAVMAVFGVPVVHEDDAVRAVRAAGELGDALGPLNDELDRRYGVRLTTRAGVHTGEVVTGDPAAGQRYATGDAVNVAARLEQAASPGQVLIGEATLRLVRDAVRVADLGELAVTGRSERVRAYRLEGVTPGAAGLARRLDTPLVGRQQELRLLRDALARCTRERACHLFTLLGAPGVGKSRLVAEFAGELGNSADVAAGRCLPYGDGITYWPLAEAVRAAVGLGEEEEPEVVRAALAGVLREEPSPESVLRPVLAALGTLDATVSPDETFWGVRRLFETIARRRALVLVFDDIQWGEPTFLDLLEHLADWSRDAPLLLICVARPDLLDVRGDWAGGKLNATTVLLESLDAGESDALLSHLLGGGALEAATRERIASSAEGNPLFIEEMVAMLLEDGLLERRNGTWAPTRDLADVPVPSTIRALLAARLDRLGDGERTVIERASIEGQVFHAGAVAALAPDAAAVRTTLLGLVRRELIRPERPTFAGEDAFRFRHLLVRDAAYEALPKELRAELHERFAAWLAARSGDRASDYAEILGYHLEEAWRYRTELSPGDDYPELAERAGRELVTAGMRAHARGDLGAVTRLLGRAARLLRRDDPLRLEALPVLAAGLSECGRLTRATEVLREAIEDAVAAGNTRVEWRARALEVWWTSNVSSDVVVSDAERVALQAIAELEAIEDDFGLAYAWRAASDAANTRGDGAAWIDRLDRAFEHARRAGNRHEEWVALGILGGAMFFGPTPVPDAIARLEPIRRAAVGDMLVEAAVTRPLGGLVALTGRVAEGWELIERGRALMRELGLGWGLAGMGFISGRIARLTGDLDTAEREYSAAVARYREMGERARLSTILGQLAAVVFEAGRVDEADAIADEAAEVSLAEDVLSEVSYVTVRARVRARRGQLDEAERLARRTASLLARSDFHGEHALALLDVAEVADACGRPDEARAAVERALALSRQKGAVLLERRCLGRLAPV